MQTNEFKEVPVEIDQSTIETTPYQPRQGGFAFKQSIVNKASEEQLRKLGMGWIWADGGSREHLRDCLTVKGWAVTPGRWKGGWKNNHKSEFLQSHFIFLDFDGGRKLVDAVSDPFVQTQAAFIYTTPSHGKPGKGGDRFRVVFEMDQEIEDAATFNRVLTGLKTLLTGSDDAINAVSCLFGNDRAKVIDFDPSNLLDTAECLRRWEGVENERRQNRAHKKLSAEKMFLGSNNDTENNLRRWLLAVPSNSYERWIRVGAWIKSVVFSGEITEDQGESIFLDWSLANYQGEKNKRNDPQVVLNTWESLTGGRNGSQGFVRANGLINIRKLYHESMLEQLTATN